MNRPMLGDALAGSFRGRLILPGDSDYDEARKVFNGMIDKRPAVIARCASTDDVVAAIDFARQTGLELAVRGGGHGGLCVCDGGVVIDLAGLNRLEVDPGARIARAGGGTLWGEFDRATQKHGLHTPGGRMSTTGISGFALGGGYGWTSSKHGLACDNLVGAEVVTADGHVLEASETENEDLFWGIRGAGANFGVVTRFDFRLHELGPTVLAGIALWPASEAPRVLRSWRDLADNAQDELSTSAAMVFAPPKRFVPDELRGRPCVRVAAMYVGDPDEGVAALQPIKDLAPHVDRIRPVPYVEFQAVIDPPPGWRTHSRGEYLSRLTDDAIDTFVEWGQEMPNQQDVMMIYRLGQAVAAVADDAAAFSHRDAGYLFHPVLRWQDPAEDERVREFEGDLAEAMRPFTTGAPYLNFMLEDGRVREAYGPEKYSRLVALKDKYDPDNLFRLNHNIRSSLPADKTARPELGASAAAISPSRNGDRRRRRDMSPG